MNIRFNNYSNVAVKITVYDIIKIVYFLIIEKNLIKKFAEELRCKSGINNVGLYSSASESIYIVLKAISHKSLRKKVIIPAYTCPSVLLVVIKAGLIPVFVDVDEGSINISEEKLKQNCSSDILAAIIPDMFGILNNYESIKRILNEFEIFFISDMSQSAALLSGICLSKEKQPEITIFSFDRAKMISTLQGGAILTRNNELFKEIQAVNPVRNDWNFTGKLLLFLKLIIYSLAVHPLFYLMAFKFLQKSASADPFRINSIKEHINKSKGFTALQAAIGLQMLTKLDNLNLNRQFTASYYLKELKSSDKVILFKTSQNYLRYPIIIEEAEQKNEFLQKARMNGFYIAANIYPVLSTVEYKPGVYDRSFPVATRLASNLIFLPVHMYIRKKDAEKLMELLKRVIA